MRLTNRYTSLLLQIVLLALFGGTLVIANSDWRQQSPIPGPGNAVLATAVTPDGTRAATVTDDGHVSLWDLNSRKLIRSRHLPYGKPHHIAIRNQDDAIAVAYEDADAVIWWCDGSDKVVPLDVRARLVAFAHQKRLLVTISQSTDYGATWDIASGDQIADSAWTKTQLPMAYLTVLPSDNGAIVHETSLVGNSRGFALQGEIEVYSSSFSGKYTAPDQIAIENANEKVLIQWFDGSGMWFTGIPCGGGPQAFNEQGAPTTRPPVFLRDESHQSGRIQGYMNSNGFIIGTHLEPANDFAPVSYQGNTLKSFVRGNTSGDLIIYRRARANDWFKHPAPWVVIPCFFFLGWVMLKRRWRKLESPAPPIDPADASLDLPRSTRIAAWVTAIIGGLSVVGFIYGLLLGSCMVNFAILGLPAGILILRKKRNGWRRFAVVMAWVIVAGGRTGIRRSDHRAAAARIHDWFADDLRARLGRRTRFVGPP